jgi:uncharacterized caspase-like protein
MNRFFWLVVLWLTVTAGQLAAQETRTLSVAAAPEKRIALVIGNSAYQQGPLKNPVNDARAIAAKLRGLGFSVLLKENLKTREIGSVYREFRSIVTPGSVALVFYAGHGLQFKGQNYFPATDADISGEEDVPLQSLNLGTLLDNMEEAKAGVSLVLLDACRDNPFARRFRSGTRGLAKAEAASGTLIQYATKPGSVAADGDGRNGTYTEALLAQMDAPGVPIELMLKKVTNQVVGKSKGKQEPWVEGSLRGDFFFKPGAGAQAAAPAPSVTAARSPELIEDELWDAIKDGSQATAFEEYLRQYPSGRYLAQARIKLAALNETAARARIPAVPKHLGCFRDRGELFGKQGRDLDGFVVNEAGMTTERCTSLCASREFAYAGTQYGTWCFCGNNYGRSGPADNCNMACDGNSKQSCGGVWANNVYELPRK